MGWVGGTIDLTLDWRGYLVGANRHDASDGQGKTSDHAAGTQAPVFDPMTLFHRPVPIKTAAEALAAANAAPAPDKTSKTCPANPEYEALIDAAARNIYEPKDLGDINSLKHKFDCDIHSRDDVYKFADASLWAAGDGYAHAMQPAEAKQFDRQLNGKFTGIGLEIAPAKAAGYADAPSNTVVNRPLPGKPAEQAGFQKGDAIVKVDGTDVHALPPADVANRITDGVPGSKVDIVIDRQGTQLEKIVTRQAIVAEPVVHDKDLGDGIAYIKIDNFGNSTEAAQLEAALDRQKNARAFVIDVRDNPGGLVDQSLKSAQLFVKSGVLMTSKQRYNSDPSKPGYNNVIDRITPTGLEHVVTDSATGESHTYNSGRLPYKIGDRPVIVLTNEKSASASEIFTGAVHDTAHDTTLGTTTFGKGIGQNVIKGIDGGGYLKITALHYLTPSGAWPGDADKHKYGLKEDIHVENPPGTVLGSPADTQLNTAVAVVKDRLQKTGH